MKKCHNNRSSRGSVIAEFGPALFLVFVMFFFPVLNFIGLGVGWATVVLVSSQSATAAAGSDTYALALQNASNTSTSLTSSALATFARLRPVGGYNNCGTDLFVASTGIGGGATIFYGPDTPVSATIDPTSNIYEYEARSTFQIGPFVNMSGIPVLGSVPGLGPPAVFSFTTQRAAEFPSGLSGTGVVAGNPFQGNKPNPPLPPTVTPPGTPITIVSSPVSGDPGSPVLSSPVSGDPVLTSAPPGSGSDPGSPPTVGHPPNIFHGPPDSDPIQQAHPPGDRTPQDPTQPVTPPILLGGRGPQSGGPVSVDPPEQGSPF